jgi:hypothetical protein
MTVMQRKGKYAFVLIAVGLSLANTSISTAQTEIEMDRSSLRNLQPLYTSVYVEAPATIADMPDLDVTALSRSVDSSLTVAGIPLNRTEPAHVIDREPFISVHLNAMDMGNGLIPFAIEVEIIQGVVVANLPNELIHAATWDTGLVGLVSHDNVDTIRWAMLDLVDEFIEDYRKVNPL